MNLSEFTADDNNATSLDNQSRCVARQPTETVLATYYVVLYASLAVGTPGNILSVIVWLRRRVAGKMSSAVYLAALAINDLVYLPTSLYVHYSNFFQCLADRSWWCMGAVCLYQSVATLESLLVLSFSIERLIAIIRPLQVCL